MTLKTASPALLTDRYEYTMLDAALADGSAHRRCVFEVFARDLPPGRRFGVVAGTGRIINDLLSMQPSDEELAWLDDAHIVSPTTLEWLATHRFTGTIVGYREGELHTGRSPVLTVIAEFGQAILRETLVLSALNYDSAVAAAAARIRLAAGDRTLLEFGSRRTHEQAALAAARASWIAGFDATSNLAAGHQYGIPTAGTSAHAFMLVHDDEAGAFDSQATAALAPTTLLVDTYDIAQGLQRAVEIAVRHPRQVGAIRIDSGDLAGEAQAARRQLDAAGLHHIRVVVSGDLDEQSIAELGHAPIDGYGVGTSLVTGSGAPTARFVYKLVARQRPIDGRFEPVAKGGGIKATTGGVKVAWRRADDDHLIETLVVADDVDGWLAAVTQPSPGGTAIRPLQVPFVVNGEASTTHDLDEARRHHRDVMATLGDTARRLDDGPSGIVIETTQDDSTPVDQG